jgi:serine/threonine-protein kinase
MGEVAAGDKLDQYLLTDLVSRGGMATIFKAVDTSSGATVAVKVPHLHYESDVVFYERFRREQEIGQRVHHPNVVRMFRPREQSRPYLVMEYVEGARLSDILRERGPLPAAEALAIACQICEALACLHEQRVVHRDLKPENVHLTASGQVKILDFGIALLGSARRITWAKLSTVSGTPDYMAPEQIRGKRGDRRTDVYALGTLLYEMLTGKLPYAADNPLALLAAKMREEPKPPRYHAPDLDPALEAVVLRAIERDPRRRHASAAELLAELRDPSAAAPREPTAQAPRRKLLVWMAIGAIVAGLSALVMLGGS